MTNGPTLARDNSAGFTLIELLVALAMFALISMAGLSLIETVTGVQQRTDGRTERLAELQRGMYLLTADFEQLTAGPSRDGASVSLTRGSASGAYGVGYSVEGNALHRQVAGVDRVVIADIAGAQWRFLKGEDWADQPTSRELPERPRAVELTLELGRTTAGPQGTIRRIVELPSEP